MKSVVYACHDPMRMNSGHPLKNVLIEDICTVTDLKHDKPRVSSNPTGVWKRCVLRGPA